MYKMNILSIILIEINGLVVDWWFGVDRWYVGIVVVGGGVLGVVVLLLLCVVGPYGLPHYRIYRIYRINSRPWLLALPAATY
jgi:hypothetical protein